MKDWMRPHAVDLVCNIIHEEIDHAKLHLHIMTTEITPEFISSWDINGLIELLSSQVTPVWSQILEAATELKGAKAKSNSRNCQTVMKYASLATIMADVLKYPLSTGVCN